MFGLRSKPSFEVHTDEDPGKTLLAGISAHGLAGLTAVDYLVKQLDLERTGHIEVEELPAITPFENGSPRHHTRLFSRPDLDVTVLVGELAVPGWAAGGFADAVIEWTDRNDVEEVVMLSGVPIAHGPADHRSFYIASTDYRRTRLDDLSAPTADEATDAGADPATDRPAESVDGPVAPAPMAGGFLDGVNGALMSRGIDSPLRTCVLTTPAHQQTPDVAAALRLLRAVDAIYDLDIDYAPLQEFADAVARHYEELAARMTEREPVDTTAEDRMFM